MTQGLLTSSFLKRERIALLFLLVEKQTLPQVVSARCNKDICLEYEITCGLFT